MITIHVATAERQELVMMTESVQESVSASSVPEGICVVFCPHTTAGITLNSQVDPLTLTDLVDEIDRLVPTRIDFRHIFDTPSDAAGHIKASIVGNSISIPISDGRLALGSSQGVFFWEFDGPRQRQLQVQIVGVE
ncbi:MAG: secondary thiamine-phosphate synthase enzyme [Dehalococcoidales bacterium]|jgi:secondary thiamine-phosphate synthase enzyme|nr:secondary thiamine-phosphate synthase enzyme [Dehalococcoidales bacterium]|tara:strand:+ start:2102 stop:2509 length:408 start_codon:yes stop_codon:yes gene_type:complete